MSKEFYFSTKVEKKFINTPRMRFDEYIESQIREEKTKAPESQDIGRIKFDGSFPKPTTQNYHTYCSEECVAKAKEMLPECTEKECEETIYCCLCGKEL